MKETQILPNKMEENKSEIQSCERKKIVGIVGAILATGLTLSAAIALHALVPEVTIPLVLFGSFFPIAGACYANCKNSQQQDAMMQNKHLKKIISRGIERNEELDKKRTMQIANLEEKQKGLLEKMSTNSVVASLGIVAWLLGSAASLVTTPAMLATIAGLITTGIAMKKLSKNEKEYYEYETRIENLTNDLLLGPLYQIKKTSGSPSTIGMNQSTGKTKENTSYGRSIDEYIERLSQSKQTTKPIQKIKK